MSEEQKEQFFDLLTMKAVYGLDEEAQRQLDEFDREAAEMEFRSLEKTAAAISMIGLDANEAMPQHLFTKVAADAGQYISVPRVEEAAPWPPPLKIIENESRENSGSPWFAWLGWAAAAAASIALAVNIWVYQPQPVEVAQVQPPPEIPRVLTPSELREEMIRSNTNMVRAEWTLGNVKDLKQIAGDVVWSDEKQAGYMRFRGLPANDPNKETYQLWIFDKTQDKATPIDGGTFDVSQEDEVVIPINAKLKAQAPEMFAVTIEKPGGVVVSSREKIAALAKVETRSS
jgi:anti-sigma-K factor RskA